MPNLTAERRDAPRYPLVLAAEVVEQASGARMHARTSDISRSGCYIDTLNPLPKGSRIRLRLMHNHETFQALAFVVYVSRSLGMGIAFSDVPLSELTRLESWLGEKNREF